MGRFWREMGLMTLAAALWMAAIWAVLALFG